jgi:hypothetical protein
VKHSDSSFFTEVLTQLAECTADMADDLKIIQLQNDLERLDREWEAESREYMVKGKNGHTSRPSPILITIIGGGMLVIGLATLFSSNDGFSSLFMLTFVGVVAFIIYSHWHKHSLLSTREEQYCGHGHKSFTPWIAPGSAEVDVRAHSPLHCSTTV